MTIRKKVLIAVPALLVLLVVAAYVFIDHIAKKAVEVGGEKAMGVRTTLDSINLKPVRGHGSLKALEIANPTGFKTPFFMRLGSGEAALDMGSLMKDTVVMNKIELDGLEANLEKTREGANYKVILDYMKKQEEAAPEPKAEGGKKFLVQEVLVKNVLVHADVSALGAKVSTLHVKIDEIRLENVGSETEGGVIMSELMGTIVKAVLVAVLEQGAKLPGAIAEDLGSGLKGVGKIGAKVTVKAAGGAVKVLGGAAKGVTGAVKGLFGGGDEEEEEKEDK